MTRRVLLLALVLMLASAGCLSALKGLVVIVKNDSDEPISGTLTLRRPNATELVATRDFHVAPGEHVKLDKLTRDAGLFVLNVTLDDGRSAEIQVRGGGALQDPQVDVTDKGVHITQKDAGTGRSLS